MEVVSATPQLRWLPVGDTSTVYVGSVVRSTTLAGVAVLGQASGVGDTTGKSVPLGVVVGTSDQTKTFSATSNSNAITGVVTQALQAARSNFGVEGWPKGDPQPMVLVALISAQTVLRSNIYNATLGVSPTVLTVTTGSTDGLGFTSNACDFTPVAGRCTTYGRSGANMGIYRVSGDTSTTVETNVRAFPQDITIGETFVRVPYRPLGQSYAQTDTNALFVTCGSSPATDYWIIDVLRLDLSQPGREFIEFRFHACHFDLVRA